MKIHQSHPSSAGSVLSIHPGAQPASPNVSGRRSLSHALEKIGKRAGNTIKVNMVEVNSPPTTTVASGRCISDPTPVDSNSGIKPNAAINAVIKTGLSRDNEASCIGGYYPLASVWLFGVT
jgi:hypothetical protein